MSEIPSRVLVMLLDDSPIAASLYFDTGDRRVFLYQTRDTSFARMSIGLVLQAEKIRRSIDDGVRSVDEMGGDPKKARLGLEDHQGFELLIGRRGVGGRAVLLARLAQLKVRASMSTLRSRAVPESTSPGSSILVARR